MISTHDDGTEPLLERRRLSRWLSALEELGCVIERRGADVYDVNIPGLDAWCFPESEQSPLARVFWDRVEVKFEAGGRRSYRWRYFSQAHLAIHAFLMALILFEPKPSVSIFLALNAIPVVASWLSWRITFAWASRTAEADLAS